MARHSAASTGIKTKNPLCRAAEGGNGDGRGDWKMKAKHCSMSGFSFGGSWYGCQLILSPLLKLFLDHLFIPRYFYKGWKTLVLCERHIPTGLIHTWCCLSLHPHYSESDHISKNLYCYPWCNSPIPQWRLHWLCCRRTWDIAFEKTERDGWQQPFFWLCCMRQLLSKT